VNQLLTIEEREVMLESHRAERNKRQADRFKTILYLDEGKTYVEIARLLFLDDSTIRRYEVEYRTGGLDNLLVDAYKGGHASLSSEQLTGLKKHLKEQLYHRAKDVVQYVKTTYDVPYSEEGMIHLLHRLGYVYKKTKLVPGKCDPERQQAFLVEYEKIKESMDETDELYFADGAHPQHNVIAGYGWIQKGTEKEIKTNSGRQRLNLNGALSLRDLSAVVLSEDTINADAVIRLCKALEEKHPNALNIYLICDNARYNHARIVREFLATSRVKMRYLPPYSPNLNLIERLWKFYHKNVQCNHYYETFEKFKLASLDFFKNLHVHKEELETLLTENFHIIGLAVS
jgi:transposase